MHWRLKYNILWGMSRTSHEPIWTLVAARPGLMRDSLVTFLRATPGVEVLDLVDDPAAALEAAGRHRLDALVMDADLSEEALLAVVQQLNTELPALNSVVLVDSVRQQRVFLAAGAHHALLKGCLDERLRAAVCGGVAPVNDEQ